MYRIAVIILSCLVIAQSSFANSVFEWGLVKGDLTAVGEKQFIGTIQSPASELRKLGRITFSFYNNFSIIDQFTTRNVYLIKYGTNRMDPILLDKKTQKMDALKGESLVYGLKPMDELVFYFVASSGETFNLRIVALKDPMGYLQPVFVPQISSEPTFKYQLATLMDNTQVLKIDTTTAENKAIVDAYRNVARVKIKHIPGFQTINNYISETDTVLIINKRAISLNIKSPKTKSNFGITEESQELNKEKCQLEWSKMLANPDSPIYSLAYGKKESYRELLFKSGTKNYNIISCRMTYFNGKELNESYYVENLTQLPLDPLKNAVEPLSIIFDQIVVKDRTTGFILITQPFIFNFE